MARQPRRIAGINTTGVGPSDIPDSAAFDTYVGPAREIIVDTQRGVLSVQNGVTPGGLQFHQNRQLPAGGTTGQVPVKTSGGGVAWANQSGGVADVSILRGYISGCTLRNRPTASNRVDIDAGVVNSDDSSMFITIPTSQVHLGTVGAGGLDAGTVAANTWYHIFVIGRDVGTPSVLASLSPTNPTLPTGFTTKRRIGSVMTDASSLVREFRQFGNKFIWRDAVSDYPATTNPGTSALLTPLTVPTGIQVEAIVWVWLESDSNSPGRKAVLITSPEQNNTAPAAGSNSSLSAGAPLGTGSSQGEYLVFTNTSRQIRLRLANSDAGTRLAVTTNGWIDYL